MTTVMGYDGYSKEPSSVSKPKSWSEIRKAVRKSHRVASQMINLMPQHFCFCQIGSIRRLYFLSIPAGNRENTLLYVDLPPDSCSSDEVLEWHNALEPFYQSKFMQLSKEEQLLRERKRQRYVGIASYDFLEHRQKAYFAFAASACLFTCSDDFSHKGNEEAKMTVSEVSSACSGRSQIDPKLCPSNPNLLAFVSGGDLWVTNTVSGCEERLSFAHNGLNDLASNPKSAGVPSFVVQEEFDRYTGYWWQPPSSSSTDGTCRDVYRILYEEVDESEVEILKIISPASDGASVDEYRYPKAGSKNAVSTLKIVEFTVDANGDIKDIVCRELVRPIFSLFPSMEYLLKAGWTPDGQKVYFELIDRRQQLTQLIVIDLEYFVRVDNISTTPSDTMDVSDDFDGGFELTNDKLINSWILYEEKSESWVNVSELLHFLSDKLPNRIRFIRGSEKTGFMHLYLVTAALDSTPEHDSSAVNHNSAKQFCNRKSMILDEIQLTGGNWVVDSKELWVDEARELVYFIGYKDTPLETHLYMVSLKIPGHVTRLTKEGFSHTVTMDRMCNTFVSVYSSISMPNCCEVYSLTQLDEQTGTPLCLGTLLEAQNVSELQSPDLFNFPSSSGFTFHGMMYKPTNLDPDGKHPVLLFLYCGPQVQLVSNSYKAIRFVRLHTLADMGFVVVVIDGRGSCHRGKEFESYIRLRLGTVEIEDQIEGLNWLSKQYSYMDMNHVAVHGWSYGGYMSLMALVQHPEVFKVAVAGAPVTSWHLYDTGYTERYLDLPENNHSGYYNGSVLKLVEKFPNEEGRLLIVQGLMDENVHFYHTSNLVDALVRACKPHLLQVYPNERHGIRSSEANEHYETMLISFLQQNL